MIVLNEAFLAVKKNTDTQALTDFASGRLDIVQGAIIANQIPSIMIRTAALCSLVNRAIETKLQLKTILEITRSIPDAATRSGTLCKILLEVEMPLETILTISRRIPIDDSRINVLCKIILRIDTSMENTKAILNEISNIQSEQKDEILNTLALSNGLGFDKALALAHAIENPVKRSITVYEVSIKYRLSKRKAYKLAGQVFSE